MQHLHALVRDIVSVFVEIVLVQDVQVPIQKT